MRRLVRVFFLLVCFSVIACDERGCESFGCDGNPGTMPDSGVDAPNGTPACTITGNYVVTRTSGPTDCNLFAGTCSVIESGGMVSFSCVGSEGYTPMCTVAPGTCGCSFTVNAGDFGTANVTTNFQTLTMRALVAGAVCDYAFRRN